jgi:hypothetical protein
MRRVLSGVAILLLLAAPGLIIVGVRWQDACEQRALDVAKRSLNASAIRAMLQRNVL